MTPAPQADEGGAAHLWQLLMVAQVPIVAYFAIKWMWRSAAGLAIVVLQICTAIAAAASVFLLGW